MNSLSSLSPKIKTGWQGIAALVSLLFVLLLVLYVFIFLRHDPTLTNLDHRLQGSSLQHPLGTDQLGRDVLTRLLLGGQQTMGFSLLALTVSLVIGIPFGLVSGFKRGVVDRIFMRIADGFLSFPDTIVAIVLSGLLGAGISNLVLAIVMVKWVSYARLVRRRYYRSPKRLRPDCSNQWFIFGPNHAQAFISSYRGHVLVLASLDLGKIILLISAFSTLDSGLSPHSGMGSHA